MIKFLQLNLDGYLHKEPLLTQLIDQHHIDILLLNELKRSSYYDPAPPTLQLPGFITHQRNFRTAILYRNDLDFKIEPYFLPTQNLFNYHNENQYIHSSSIRIIDRKTNSSIEIHNVCRPNSNYNTNFIKFIELVQQQQSSATHRIIAGDLNLHHIDLGRKKTDKAGRLFKNYLTGSAWIIANNKSPTHGNSVIDFTLADINTIDHLSQWRVLNNTNLSDHQPITFNFSFPAASNPAPTWKWNLRAADEDWVEFTQFTAEYLKFDVNRDVETNVTNITLQIVQAARDSIGRTKRRTNSHPWWNKKLQFLKNKKRKIQRKLTKSFRQRNPTKYKKIKFVFNKTKRKMQKYPRRRKELHKSRMNDELTITKHTEAFWNFVNNPLTRTQPQLPNILDENGKEIIVTEKKLELSPPQPTQVDEETKEHYEEVRREAEIIIAELTDPNYNKVKIDSILNKPITLREIQNVISKLESNKASGPDSIPNSFLKRMSKNGLRVIQQVFNQSLDTGVYPSVWNSANISPIPKPGKPHTKPSHFRPIAVSSCLGRVLEKILADRLQTYCITNQIFNNNQCGFQTNRSTTDLLTILINDARDNLDNYEACHLVTIDFSKAYDTVWHDGLLFKLSRYYLINGKILKWLTSFLSGRYARTTNNGNIGKNERSVSPKAQAYPPYCSSSTPMIMLFNPPA